VVVYKREDFEHAKVRDHADKSFRWVLVHMPSRGWAGIGTRDDAMLHMGLAAKGEDHHGILPKTVAGPEEVEFLQGKVKSEKGKVKRGANSNGEEKTAKGGEDPPSEGGKSVPTRARGDKKGVEDEDEDVPHALAFQRRMVKEFGPDTVVAEIKSGLGATRSFVVGKGEDAHVEETPDYQTRVKFVELIVKYNIGMPDKRDKLKEEKRVTLDELQNLARRSPAARKALRRILDEAEREAAGAMSKP
jgi:hypothetical protein